MYSDKIEQLSPDNLTEKLKSRQEDLSVLLAKKLRAIKNAPEGHLRIAQAHNRNKIQYFHITKAGDTKGTYIPHNQHLLAKRLAQKQYDQSLIKVLHWQIAALTRFIAKSEKQIENLYDKLCPSRRELITPATLPDEQYIAAWKSVQWEGHSFSPDQHTYTTARGEVVRSKSEVNHCRHSSAPQGSLPLRVPAHPQKRQYNPPRFSLSERTHPQRVLLGALWSDGFARLHGSHPAKA